MTTGIVMHARPISLMALSSAGVRIDTQMILYHVTSSENAAAIKRDGFRDTGGEHHGVWLSDCPLDASEGAPYTVIAVIFLCRRRT